MSRILFAFFFPLLLMPDVTGAKVVEKKKVKVIKRAGSTIVRIVPAGQKRSKKLEADLQAELRSKAHAVN